MAMSRRVVNSGALFSYVSRGLGRVAGVGASFVAVVVYATTQIGLYGAFAAWAVIAVLGMRRIDLSGRCYRPTVWQPAEVGEHPGDPLTDSEVATMFRLLARFAEHDLDQWDNWRLNTSYGPVYVNVRRALGPGWQDDAFIPVWPLLPRFKEAGRGDAYGG